MDDHSHGKERSIPGRYLDFVDELFRLGLVDQEKREFLRRGLADAGAAAPLVQPTSTHIRPGEAAERSERKPAGAVGRPSLHVAWASCP